MSVIYEPKGRAREYSELACNLYQGCTYGCSYCYVPAVLHTTKDQFHFDAEPLTDILERLEKDCKKLEGDPRTVLLCFTCDPYPAVGHELTRAALHILERYRMRVRVLTKGGRLAIRDFDILARNGWTFGQTVTVSTDSSRRRIEPYSSTIQERLFVQGEAKREGIKTWLSVEPVTDPPEALQAIKMFLDCTDFFAIGKINYQSALEKSINWKLFVAEAAVLLSGKEYLFKKDTLEAAR